MAKQLMQITILGAQLIGRAFTKALRQELQYAQTATQSGKTTTQAVQADRIAGMTLQEARQILNMSVNESVTAEELKANYDYLFQINDRTRGGSFYLQSKIYRAKERIEQELKSSSERGLLTYKKKRDEATMKNVSTD
ncbi:unnamed protein product [Didymodactylos carnosus]|uniref:Mitochondrial import inner membrane translocase subunit Tim16 n=1 Tax=Didymodactylos carnosus TaxID=1234261 RepID=A0A813VGP7_9BILA|nr:unnamed protein product [Didymodactylos carnosus]CAF0853561.1 unnamed protein product [Didymodactylos carnosus]CAF3632860.1 unnamed protein product [Didymodactylos carnosus]CAF3638726.1 unnamed protein product [Didymodactylos carnosus]